jgi:hypothetical protein
MNSLATIELQLVMHHLDNTSILRMARCTKHFYAAARQPFAWAHASEMHLESDEYQSISRQSVNQIVTSLMRWVPIFLVVSGTPDMSWMHLPHIRSLTIFNQSPAWCASLCLHPPEWMHRIICLSIDSHAESLLYLVPLMPHVHTIRCATSYTATALVLEPLTHAPCLTHLSVRTVTNAVLSPLSRCSGLTFLDIGLTSLGNGILQRLFMGTSLTSLHHLTLTGCNSFASESDDEYDEMDEERPEEEVTNALILQCRTVWPSLIHLRTLTLYNCECTGIMIASLDTAHTLEMLRITAAVYFTNLFFEDCHITPHSIKTLLATIPRLRVTIAHAWRTDHCVPCDFHYVKSVIDDDETDMGEALQSIGENYLRGDELTVLLDIARLDRVRLE